MIKLTTFLCFSWVNWEISHITKSLSKAKNLVLLNTFSKETVSRVILLFQLRNIEESFVKMKNEYCSELQKSIYNATINACCIIISVSNIKIVTSINVSINISINTSMNISNQCIKTNVWSIVWLAFIQFIRRCCRNLPVKRTSENMLTQALLLFLFIGHGFIQIRFGLFDFFCCFMSSKYYLSKLMLLNFYCQKIFFLLGGWGRALGNNCIGFWDFPDIS